MSKNNPGNRLPPKVRAALDAAKGFLAAGRASHDFDHTLRVMELCRRVGPPEGADMEVLLIAAALHDIGRPAQDESRGKICHAAHGAVLAGEVLDRLCLPRGKRQNVLHCIRAHRFRGDCPPETVEAKVLFDCDKLDSIGAIGVARTFQFAGEVGARLHNRQQDLSQTRAYSEEDTGYREYRLKLSMVAGRMMTEEGRRLAKKRHAFMEAFFERFLAEHEARD
ncbi:MAG: HD domain-containing protein [Deltaproteobacteria bacterium]|nr:HD domain-containing protein [Deltaproteobacteria bacterium]